MSRSVQTIGLIDYGMGNLFSVQMCFERLGSSLKAVQHPEDLEGCQALILPGVGAFDPAMDRLEATGLIPELVAWNKADRPLLGICLGLQLLFESSEEGQRKGLGLLPGRVKALPKDQGERIPHMGWGRLQIDRPSPLLPDPSSEEWMYFVHSFAAEPHDEQDRAASVAFGSGSATAAVWRKRLGACQFHPEKSAVTGQRLLSRWLEWLHQGSPLVP